LNYCCHALVSFAFISLHFCIFFYFCIFVFHFCFAASHFALAFVIALAVVVAHLIGTLFFSLPIRNLEANEESRTRSDILLTLPGRPKNAKRYTEGEI